VSGKRRPGSNRGRALIDWQEAFLFYASLPVEQRDYQTVADEFGVSRRTVERHGSHDRWKQQARELDRESMRAAAERLRDERTDKLVDTEKLVEATYLTYANQLVAGNVKVTPNHVVKLFELRERIWSRQDDEADGELEALADPAEPIDPTERKLEVLRALADAGVVDRLLHPDHEEAQAMTASHDEHDEDRREREIA
jgi:hypothetical protein